LISTIEQAAKLSGRRVLLQSSWTDLSKAKTTASTKAADVAAVSETSSSSSSTTLAQKASQNAKLLMKMLTTPEGKFEPSSAAAAVVGLGAGAAPVSGDTTHRLSVENDLFHDNDDADEDDDQVKNKTSAKNPAAAAAVDAEEEEDESELLFNIGGCPHEWLFPYVCAVVHHGGAGTVAAGLRAGKPTIVCPFFGDQHFWGVALERAKVGFNLGAVSKLTPQKLADGFK
jgi:hypothetical protein